MRGKRIGGLRLEALTEDAEEAAALAEALDVLLQQVADERLRMAKGVAARIGMFRLISEKLKERTRRVYERLEDE